MKRGGFPEASFLVDFKDGYDPGGAFAGAVVEDAPSTGMHGYLPSRPAMRSAFLIQGEDIAQGRDLGVIDMRQIAPTLAGLLKIDLPTANPKAAQGPLSTLGSNSHFRFAVLHSDGKPAK